MSVYCTAMTAHVRATAALFLAIFTVSAAAEDVDPLEFEKTVVQDKYAWLVEFSSAMCGSCNEFKPEWEKLSSQLKRVRTTHVSIDEPAGKKLAEGLGVMKEGIPNVKFFMKAGGVDSATTLVKGEASSARQLKLVLKPLLKGLEKEGGDGRYLKGEGGLLWVKSEGPCIEHKWCPDNLPRDADDRPHDNCPGWYASCKCTCDGINLAKDQKPAGSDVSPPKPGEPARKMYLGKHVGAVVDSVRKYTKFVESDPRVWVLEFFSSKSGESKVFSRTWEALTVGLKRIHAGVVDIDTEGGRALAEKLGAMQDGLPSVRLLYQKDGAAAKLMSGGELKKKKALREAIKPLLADLQKDDLGYFLKAEEGDPAADEL